MTREEIVHAIHHHKTHRFVPVETNDEGKKKRELVLSQNSKALEQEGSLSTEQAYQLAAIGQGIERYYGMPMDVEFVFDPAKETFYLVQARPIPKGSQKARSPSALSPEILAEIKTKKDCFLKAEIISPAANAVQIVREVNQCHSFENIDDALNTYLKTRNSPLKVVNVQRPAPPTGHQAAQFNADGVVVMRVNQPDVLKEWLNAKNVNLIFDPQRKLVVNWDKFNPGNQNQNIKTDQEMEQTLLKTGAVKVGLFESSLPAEETLIPIFSPEAQARGKKILKSQAGTARKDSSETLGKLIRSANSKNSKESEQALQTLIPYLFSLLSSSHSSPSSSSSSFSSSSSSSSSAKSEKAKEENIGKTTKEKSAEKKIIQAHTHNKPYYKLNDYLDKLKLIKIGDPNVIPLQSLSEVLKIFYQISKYEEAHPQYSGEPRHYGNIFRQAMITGAEVYKSLRRLSQLSSQTPKGEQEALQAEYFNSLRGLDALSEALREAALDKKNMSSARKIKGTENLNAKQLEYFSEFVKFKKIALNQKIEQEWLEFSLKVAQDKNLTQRLSRLIKFSIENKIESDWLNQSFIQTLKTVQKDKKEEANQSNVDVQTALTLMDKDMEKVKKVLEDLNFKKIKMILFSWENRIGEWADPNKFDKLWKEYVGEFLPLIEKLSITPDMPSLAKKSVLRTVQAFTEIMDRTIKSMKGSPEYKEQKLLQLQRFAKLLTPYHQLMEKWVRYIPEKQFLKWAENVSGFDRHYNLKDGVATTVGWSDNINPKDMVDAGKGMLEKIKDVFETIKQKKLNDITQVNSGGRMNVSAVKIGSTASFRIQFVDMDTFITLEDLFTLFHQNILTSTAFLDQENRLPIETLPGPLQPMVKSILNINIDRGRLKTKSELLNLSHQYPFVTLDFNFPLRDHSIQYQLIYNQLDQSLTFNLKFFGANEWDRMDVIANLAHLEMVLLGAELLTIPKFNEYSLGLEIELKFKGGEDQFNTIGPILASAIENYAYITTMRNPRASSHDLLKRLHILEANPLRESLLDFSLISTPTLISTLELALTLNNKEGFKQENESWILVQLLLNRIPLMDRKKIENLPASKVFTDIVMIAFEKRDFKSIMNVLKVFPNQKWLNELESLLKDNVKNNAELIQSLTKTTSDIEVLNEVLKIALLKKDYKMIMEFLSVFPDKRLLTALFKNKSILNTALDNSENKGLLKIMQYSLKILGDPQYNKLSLSPRFYALNMYLNNHPDSIQCLRSLLSESENSELNQELLWMAYQDKNMDYIHYLLKNHLESVQSEFSEVIRSAMNNIDEKGELDILDSILKTRHDGMSKGLKISPLDPKLLITAQKLGNMKLVEKLIIEGGIPDNSKKVASSDMPMMFSKANVDKKHETSLKQDILKDDKSKQAMPQEANTKNNKLQGDKGQEAQESQGTKAQDAKPSDTEQGPKPLKPNN